MTNTTLEDILIRIQDADLEDIFPNRDTVSIKEIIEKLEDLKEEYDALDEKFYDYKQIYNIPNYDNED